MWGLSAASSQTWPLTTDVWECVMTNRHLSSTFRNSSEIFFAVLCYRLPDLTAQTQMLVTNIGMTIGQSITDHFCELQFKPVGSCPQSCLTPIDKIGFVCSCASPSELLNDKFQISWAPGSGKRTWNLPALVLVLVLASMLADVIYVHMIQEGGGATESADGENLNFRHCVELNTYVLLQLLVRLEASPQFPFRLSNKAQ